MFTCYIGCAAEISSVILTEKLCFLEDTLLVSLENWMLSFGLNCEHCARASISVKSLEKLQFATLTMLSYWYLIKMYRKTHTGNPEPWDPWFYLTWGSWLWVIWTILLLHHYVRPFIHMISSWYMYSHMNNALIFVICHIDMKKQELLVSCLKCIGHSSRVHNW